MEALKYHTQLKMVRIQNKLTQQQVADALGITRSAYCSYEIGRRSPDLDSLIRLSEFYRLNLAEFLSELNGCLLTDADSFDASEKKWYLSELSREERDLIVRLRSMTDNEKAEVYSLAEGKNEKK